MRQSKIGQLTKVKKEGKRPRLQKQNIGIKLMTLQFPSFFLVNRKSVISPSHSSLSS